MIPAVGIIGGGISGTCIVLNLLKQARKPLHILWFDAHDRFCKGLAYSTKEKSHLLNVRAGNMSVFTDEPDHFVKWLELHYPEYTATDFVPRNLFGVYVTDTYQALKESNKHLLITCKAEEVTAIDRIENTYRIHAKGTDEVHKIILALGNFLPANPPSRSNVFTQSTRYFRDAFHEGVIPCALAATSLTIIGAGLTMLDIVVALEASHYKGKITIISPHGYLPQAHTQLPEAPLVFSEPGHTYTLGQLYSRVKSRLKLAIQNGLNPQRVIDGMRPHLQEWWLRFTFEEKKRFLRHLRHKWGVARHRAPLPTIGVIKQMLQNQQLTVIKGRIFTIETDEEGFTVSYSGKGKTGASFKTEVLINCTGPEPDITKTESPLLKQLINNGLISSDELGYGIRAHRTGKISENIYTIGPPLKGLLWESTAVPEIRLQAKELASEIILD